VLSIFRRLSRFLRRLSRKVFEKALKEGF